MSARSTAAAYAQGWATGAVCGPVAPQFADDADYARGWADGRDARRVAIDRERVRLGLAPSVVVNVADAAEADRDALRRELDALRQTHTGDLARERERVEAAERECERRGAELARVRAAVRMHESAREQMDAHDRATLRSLAGDSRAVLIEELAGARRERDDWNARATSLEFERDAAIADAAGLRRVDRIARSALDELAPYALPGVTRALDALTALREATPSDAATQRAGEGGAGG